MVTRSLAFMYHAVSDDPEDRSYDPVYAVSTKTFSEHLDVIANKGRRVASLRERLDDASLPPAVPVYFTFDDGHVSNLEAAMQLLERGYQADFFVNPGLIGKRYLMSWSHLIELVHNGMSIQSHGMTHGYLDDMSSTEIRAELERSKNTIEDKVGARVDIFAPAGGRMTREVPVIARELGYRILCTSEPGMIGPRIMRTPRIAIRAHFNASRMSEFIEHPRRLVTREKTRFFLLHGAKQLLGNRGYDALRSRLLRQGDNP